MTPPKPAAAELNAAVLGAFAKQVGWCERLRSPFTAQLLRALAEDLAQGGDVAGLVGRWPGDPVSDAVPLRLAGALHALVLSGSAPGLAACFPPAHSATPEALAAALRATVSNHLAAIGRFIQSPPQTNEVGRSGVLLGGFLAIAAGTGLPLRLLEIGASAGLNLLWDHYGYRLGAATWGDPASAVQLAPHWTGPLPPLAVAPIVAERAGCDLAPVDLREPQQQLRLRAYIWPDQAERLARLDAAIAIAQAAAPVLTAADAADWVGQQLAHPAPGRTTVLFHSIMWQYMPAATQRAIQASIAAAGEAATDAAPVAWLRFEPPQPEARPELRLSLWPGGTDRLLATAHPHGVAVTWLR